VIGLLTGTILHGFKTARDILDPLFATYYAIPIFAFYPLFIVTGLAALAGERPTRDTAAT